MTSSRPHPARRRRHPHARMAAHPAAHAPVYAADGHAPDASAAPAPTARAPAHGPHDAGRGRNRPEQGAADAGQVRRDRQHRRGGGGGIPHRLTAISAPGARTPSRPRRARR